MSRSGFEILSHLPKRTIQSVRGRLLALITLAALPALMLLGFSTWNTQRLQSQAAFSDAGRTAGVLAREIEAFEASIFDLMRTLVLTRDIRTGDSQACADFLLGVLRQERAYLSFSRIDPRGTVTCTSRTDAPAQIGASPLLGQDWGEREFYVVPYMIDPGTGRPVALVARRLEPVSGGASGFLIAAVDLHWLSDRIGGPQLREGSTVTLLDREGRVLLHFPDPVTWVGRNVDDTPLGRAAAAARGEHGSGPESGAIDDLDGLRRIYGFQPVQSFGIGSTLAAGNSVERALQVGNETRTYNTAAIILALLGVVITPWFASRALVLRWTDRMLSAARRVTAGNYDARVGGPYDRGELGELARTFDQMLDEVGRREGELQRREEWFRSVVQHSTDMITIVDRAGVLRYASPAAERVLGYVPEDLEGRSLLSVCHPAERARFSDILKYLSGYPNRVAAVEHRLCHAEGHYIDIETIGVNLMDNPAVAGIVVNSRDVTRRRRVEEMLRLVTMTVDQARDGVVIMTAEREEPGPEIVYVNPALLQLTGIDESDLIGKAPTLFRSDEANAVFAREIERCFAAEADRRFEIENPQADSEPSAPIEVDLAPLKDLNGEITHFVAQCRDVTAQRKADQERQRLEETLRQASKMEAVGTLAGGIAHDFNNVLLPMMMLTQLTLNRLPGDSKERQNLGRVLSAQRRAKALVGQILAFSRGSSGEYLHVDLASICRETLHLLRASLPATVVLLEDLQVTPLVRADPTQIQQVIMNLCSNAAQAMPAGKGTITVRLDAVTLDGSDIPEGLVPGLHSRLRVVDDGSGIPPEIVARIFDPFFTTKEVGVGTGLGLSVVHGIVTAHRGAIWVDTGIGTGTEFTILLPVVPAEAESLRETA